MQQAQEVQSCMQQIDQAEVQRVKAEAEAVAEEIQGMCVSGDRSAAQSRAVSYGKQLEKEPVVQEAPVVEVLIDRWSGHLILFFQVRSDAWLVCSRPCEHFIDSSVRSRPPRDAAPLC